MSASSLAAIWIAALLPGAAVVVLVLSRRASGPHEQERHARRQAVEPPKPVEPPVTNESALAHDLLLLRVSHDLRGPLGSVVTLCQLLTEGDAGPLTMKQRQYIDVIRRGGQSVLALVDDILDLAALESGRADPETEPVELSSMLRALAESQEAAARERGVPIQLALPRQPVAVLVDERRTHQLLHRMVEQVLVSTEQGYIELALEAAGDSARVCVRNTRDGLSDSARQALAQGGGGSGDLERLGHDGTAPLPIALAARLARHLGTPLEVHSGEDEGLSLELALPLAEDTAAAPPEQVRPRRATGTRILLIDDDAAERLSVTARLEEVGYLVTTVSSGSEGLSRLQHGQFDAVVLDLVMPGLSGLEVLRAARSDERLAHLPFVVLSALYITRSERAVLGPSVASVVRKGDSTADDLLRAIDRALVPAAEVPTVGGDRHV